MSDGAGCPDRNTSSTETGNSTGSRAFLSERLLCMDVVVRQLIETVDRSVGIVLCKKILLRSTNDKRSYRFRLLEADSKRRHTIVSP